MNKEKHLEDVGLDLGESLSALIFIAMESYAKEVADKQSIEFAKWGDQQSLPIRLFDEGEWAQILKQFHSTRESPGDQEAYERD